MPSAAHGIAVGRLKQRRDFLRVAGQQRKWVTPGLILQAAPMPRAAQEAASMSLVIPPVSPDVPAADPAESTIRPTLPVARVGFTVSKKVGNSVARNRARRRLRAAVDQILATTASPGIDYVLIGRQQTLDRPFDDLLRDLETALKRVLTAPVRSGQPPRGRSSKGRGKAGPEPKKTQSGRKAAPPRDGPTPNKQADGE